MKQNHTSTYSFRPSVIDAGQRALALRTVIARYDIESNLYFDELKEHVDEEREELNGFLNWVINKGKVYPFLTPNECDMTFRPLGQWEHNLVEWDGLYWSEALGTLLWSLGIVEEFSDFGEGFNSTEIVYGLEIMNSPADFLRNLKLRSYGSIAQKRELTFAYLLRTVSLLTEESEMTELESDFSIKLGKDLRVMSLISGTINGILPACGSCISMLDEESLNDINLNCRQRLIALNWLLGDFYDWDNPMIIPNMGEKVFLGSSDN